MRSRDGDDGGIVNDGSHDTEDEESFEGCLGALDEWEGCSEGCSEGSEGFSEDSCSRI